MVKMKDPTLIMLGWEDGGPIVDIISMEFMRQRHSLFCINLTFIPMGLFIEFFGIVLIDTYNEDINDN